MISHPTLILTNTGDAIFEHAERATRLRPDFAFFALDGGGIDAVDELTNAWVDAVTAFLRPGRPSVHQHHAGAKGAMWHADPRSIVASADKPAASDRHPL